MNVILLENFIYFKEFPSKNGRAFSTFWQMTCPNHICRDPKLLWLVIRRAPMWQQSGTLQFCSCHGIAGFLVQVVHELEI